MKKWVIFSLLLFLTSCNKDCIEELESENKRLNLKISLLEQQVNYLSDKKEELESEIAQMQQDMSAIRRCAGNASSNASSAAFWSSNGNTFFFESELRSMSSNFDDIVRISSKY